VNGYTNKIKGANGTYKFMVCSIVVNKKRYILMILPMHNNQDTRTTVLSMLKIIRKKFRIETAIFDRGFCEKKLPRDLEKLNVKYLIFGKKYSNIKRHLNAKKTEVIENKVIRENKTKTNFDWRFVFAYDQFGHDWLFSTNLKNNPNDLVKLYKCRWGIETNFRIMDLADIKSKSKNIVTRCFFFLISAILFNSWLDLDKKITFEKYLDFLSLASMKLDDILIEFKTARNFLNLKISMAEKRILSSINYFSIQFNLN
jgi:putative transposase